MGPFAYTFLSYGAGITVSLYRYFSWLDTNLPPGENRKLYGSPITSGLGGLIGGVVVAGVSLIFPALSIHSWTAATMAFVASWGVMTAYVESKSLRGLMQLLDKEELKRTANKDFLLSY